MNYLEIAFKDVKKGYLKTIMETHIEFNLSNIIGSHFFDKTNNKNIEYQNIQDIEKHFQNQGIGHVLLKKVFIGTELKDVMLLISCNENLSDLTIHFRESQFDNCDIGKLNVKVKKLFLKLLDIQKECEVPEIIVGYEPAEDEDTRIF